MFVSGQAPGLRGHSRREKAPGCFYAGCSEYLWTGQVTSAPAGLQTSRQHASQTRLCVCPCAFLPKRAPLLGR